MWRVLLPRLFTKIVEDWRAPDSPFWVVQSKNTANNGVKAHAGALLATYESGAAYEVEANVVAQMLEHALSRSLLELLSATGRASAWRDRKALAG